MPTKEPTFELSSLYIYQTDSCNLRCSHCWISPKFSQSKQNDLPLDSLKRTVTEAKPLGLQSVKITGGEPLLYSELPSFLSFLDAEGLTVYIETNGTLMDRDIINHFKSSNVKQVSVSVDAASEKIHDEIRGVKGSLNRTLEGLRLLSKAGVSSQIIMTLQQKNRNEIPGVIRLSNELGAGSLKINHLIPTGRGKKAFARGDNLGLEELIGLCRLVKEKYPRRENLEIIFDLPLAFRSIDAIKRGGTRDCRILNILGILANGDFSICGIGQTIPELRMGNIHHDSVSSVWNKHPILKELRQSLPSKLEGICQDCIFKFQCLGACRANAYALSGGFYTPYFLCQKLFDAGQFPSSRRIKRVVEP